MPLFRDLAPLFAMHFVLLLATLFLGPGNLADVRVQLAWTGFLTLGWLLAPQWLGEHTSFIRRYLAAMISSVAFHSILVAAGSISDLGINTYVTIWISATLIALIQRAVSLNPNTLTTRRVPLQHWLAMIVLIVFVVCVYRTPRSNDIHQFLLQQQDMLAEHSLRVTSIGMSAMDVDQPMPRWKAHYWHLLPCIIAHTSGIAVDQVLLRYATIPVAFSVLLCLTELVRSLAGKRVPYAIALIAILGPVLLWYRNFNAFNYSFRISNNLLLDKDFALFFLIPSIIWLTKGWIQGRRRYIVPLIGLLPAVVRFHPLTAVYLLLLAVPIAVLVTPLNRSGVRRTAVAIASAFTLFIVVVLIGDAQSNHEQIRAIVQMDYLQSLDERPLHYWVGFYNTIPDTPLPSDTTQWTGRQFHLKNTLISGCGLLAMMHFGLLALATIAVLKRPRGLARRVLFAGLVTMLMLWGMWLVSGGFLTRFPHYAGGYERLHWFAYSIALIVSASALASLVPRRIRRAAGFAIFAWVLVSSVLYRLEIQSPLIHVRGVNSLLDAEMVDSSRRRADWAAISPTRSLDQMRPDYLQSTDRALLLDPRTTKHYWLTRQGVFWSDAYVEAFAWFHRDDDFLTDRRFFYDLLDRRPVAELGPWLAKKRITLIIDMREGGDAALAELSDQDNLTMRRLEQGVWRVEP